MLDRPLAPEIAKQFAELAQRSLEEQRALEAADDRSLEDYLHDYLSLDRLAV
jgi:glutamate--cysteine ligase